MKSSKFIILLLLLTIISIGAVSAADDVLTNGSVSESCVQDDFGSDVVEYENSDYSDKLGADEDNILQNDDNKQELNRSYYFNPAEVDKDYPSVWINMEVDSQGYLGEGNVSIYFNNQLLGERSLEFMTYYGCDVDLPYGIEYGQYNLVVKFDGNDQYKAFTDTVPFNVSYRFVPLINGNSFLSYNFEYGTTAYLDVFLPYGTYGILNVTYGGRKVNVNVFDGNAYWTIDELLLGKHDLIMEYGDNEYPYKKVVRSINVSPIVNVPDTVVFNDDATISISMNPDASGNITVSIDGVEVYNNPILNGRANIPLQFTYLGLHNVVIAYNGNDYSFDPIRKSVNYIPKVNAPRVVGLSESAMIYLHLPSSYNGDIVVQRATDTFYGNVVNGQGSVMLTGLSDNLENIFEIYYTDSSSYSWMGSCYINVVNETHSGYQFEVDVPRYVFREGYVSCPINIPSAAIGTITVYIDGKYFDEISTLSGFYSYDFSPANLGIGLKTIKFEYSGDDYFVAKTYSTTFRVSPFKVEYMDTILLGYSDEMNVYFEQDCDGWVSLYIDGKEFATTFVDSKVTFSLSDLKCGNHNWEIKYIDVNLLEISQDGSFNVGFYNRTQFNYAVYGEPAIVKVYLPEDATGKVYMKVMGTVYEEQAKNGEVTFTIEGLRGGAYYSEITYGGDDKYPNALLWADSDSFPGLWVNYVIKITSDNMRLDESSTVYLLMPNDAEGRLWVYLDGNVYGYSSFINGNATVTLSNLDVGYHYLTCIYDSYDYTYYSEVYGITVHGYQIELSDEELHLNNNGNVSINLPSDARGNLIVWVDNELFANVPLVNGKASIPLSNLTLGYHDITADYRFGDDYVVDTLWKSVEVISDVDIPAEISAGENKFITVMLPDDADGYLSASFYNDIEFITVDGNEGCIPLSSLPHGEYYVSVSYSDVKYGGFYENGRIIVKNPSPEINIGLINMNSTVLIELPRDATGNLIIYVDGAEYFRKLSNGKVLLDVGTLAYGNHTVEVKYSGDEKYSKTNDTAIFNIPRITKSTSIFVIMVNGLEITSVLKDVDGKPLVGMPVVYYVNGGVGKVVYTNSEGEFITPVEDNSVLSMSFGGNELYSDCNAKITIKNIRPVQKDTQIVVPSTMKFTAVDYKAGETGSMFYFYLKDKDGKGLANRGIKIGIFDKIYTVKTDKNGRGGLQINIANANYYTYAITFLGDNDYKASFNVCSLQIVKKSVTITPAKTSYSFKANAKTKTVTATLKSINSYIPKGKQVTLAIAGKTFKATIGNKGQISFNIGSITKKGTYKVTINYAGSNTYSAATSKAITIKIA